MDFFRTEPLRAAAPRGMPRSFRLALAEDEAYRGAAFYDSPTRTLRSAVRAYERFLAEYPTSERAEAVRARIEELKAKIGARQQDSAPVREEGK